MTIVRADPVYCSKCGRKANPYARTLDPRYPLVSCSDIRSDGGDTGCGVVAGTYDSVEASALVTERTRRRVTGQHAAHLRAKVASPLCDECPAAPPARPAQAHPLEEFDTKYRLASHLELGHGDGSLRPRLTVRNHAELASYHKRLHDSLT